MSPKIPRPAGKGGASYDPQRLSGSTENFPYSVLPVRIPERQMAAYAKRLRRRYTRLAKGWDEERNSEWLVRSYFSMKLLLASGLMLSAAYQVESARLRIAEPDLVDHSLFHAARAFILLLPDQKWSGGALFSEMTPEKAARIVGVEITGVEPVQGGWLAGVMKSAHAYQRLFQERFPLTGRTDDDVGVRRVPLDVGTVAARFLAELTQWVSEILGVALTEHVTDSVGWDMGLIASSSRFVIADGVELIDEDAARQLGELMGAEPRPGNLWARVREKLVEGFPAPEGGKRGKGDDSLDWRLVYPFK